MSTSTTDVSARADAVADAHRLVTQYQIALEAVEDLRTSTHFRRSGATADQPEYPALAQRRDEAREALVRAILGAP